MEKYMNKQIKLSTKKERVILSDVLPYETPAIFSNKHFYKFLLKYKIECYKQNKLSSNNNEILKSIFKILFNYNSNTINIKTTPFNFKIPHKTNDFRELSIIHPANQLYLIYFYNTFKEAILYYTNNSNFSIRKPYKIGKYRKTSNNKSENIDMISDDMKTFFVYSRYTNIQGFFESRQYQLCEKKFTNLYKFDISKCFDSIYTHSIAWAIYDKYAIKENLNFSKKTFAGLFDGFMQDSNYSETNGIVIGPEFSRIFAEIILQDIDRKVYVKLKNQNIYHKKDYELCRYVDDYFLFYNDEKIRDEIVELFKHNLKVFKLFINESKTICFARPIMTNISIAKIKILDLISNEIFEYYNRNLHNNGSYETAIKQFKSTKLISNFKMIIKETNIEYKDILNYTLSILRETILKAKIDNCKNVIELLDFVFFIYSVAPRVTTTMHLCEFILAIIKQSNKFAELEKQFFVKKIFDEIYQLLKINKAREYVQNETLYLLLLLEREELYCYKKIEEDVLLEYFKLNEHSCNLNYFEIVVLLFYIKNDKKYDNIKEKIKEHIGIKIANFSAKDTESVLLFFDLLVCPFLDVGFKKNIIMNKININNKDKCFKFIKKQKNWFVQWRSFDLEITLKNKKSSETY